MSCKPCKKTSINTNQNQSNNSGSTKPETNQTNQGDSSMTNTPKPIGSEDLSTIQCGKKILSITKVKDKVLVMYDDCSYSTAPLSVVASESFSQDAVECLAEQNKFLASELIKLKEKYGALDYEDRIKALETKPDKDTIYNDAPLVQRITALENKPEYRYDDSNIKQSITNLGNKVDNKVGALDNKLSNIINNKVSAVEAKLTDYVKKSDLVEVSNLEGTQVLFKAYPV